MHNTIDLPFYPKPSSSVTVQCDAKVMPRMTVTKYVHVSLDSQWWFDNDNYEHCSTISIFETHACKRYNKLGLRLHKQQWKHKNHANLY